ncbi:MAG TPA: hypothetical protein VF168_06235 [Trueperaceae bacterium]
MRSVSRLYEHIEDAVAAADDLIASGFDPASISVISPRSSQSLGFDSMDDMAIQDDPDGMAAGAAIGASVGAALGGATGLLMGLGLLVIPGIGPALAIGPLASAIAGLSLGGATGGVTGALVRGGVPPIDSNEYSLALRRGESLVFLQVPAERMVEAGQILDRYGPVRMVNSRAERLEGGHERRVGDFGPEYRAGRRGDRRRKGPVTVRRDDPTKPRDDIYDEA